MNRKPALYVLAAAAVVAVGAAAYIFTQDSTSALLAQTGGAQQSDVKPTDMVHGKADAPVTMIEYASMTCSHCAAFQQEIVPQLTKDYIDTGKVKFVFREFPLDGAARLASATARCMTGDNYFAFIDLLFRNQQEWLKDADNNQQITKEDIEEGLVRMGRMAGMSRERVLACSNDEKNLALVDANWQEGQNRYKVGSTPTFVINGTVHAGGMSYETLKTMLDPLVAQN